MLNYIHKLKPYLPFLIFFIISVVLRLININDALFFTWDQGRDFFAIKQIVDGNITLIGPTTGLPGLFLGPLWYYIGIPGYILGQGNPYFFTLWYIFITLSSLPLFWMMGKALFKNRHLAIVCAYALSLVPGGVWGTIRVWNPLIAIPLMTAAFLALVKARKSRLFLGLGFFLMGLTLHSEFAYAIFFCTTMVLLVPWIRQKFSFKDIVIAVTAVGITLLPQIVFEVRHDFIMSRTMIATATDPDAEHIAWDYHLSRRPMKLIEATSKLVTGGDQHPGLVFSIIVASWIIASKSILSSRKKSSTISWSRQLLLVMAVLPYPFYMVWKGNHGYFFDYYLTSHFIFLIPLAIVGLDYIHQLLKKKTGGKNYGFIIPVIAGFILAYWYVSLINTTIKPNNNAGLKKMDQAITQLIEWIEEDDQSPGVVRVFTPNRETEHYDAILHWRARKLDLPIPHTVMGDDTTHWYILIEPDYQWEKRLNDWHAENTIGGIKTRSEQVGVMTLESWQTPGSMVEVIN